MKIGCDYMRCEICLQKENLFMCFTTGKKKELYLCASCLGKSLLDEPSEITIYSMNKLGYTWKKSQEVKKVSY